MSLLHNLRLLLLAAWLGAAIFFSAAVAPGAFRVLRTFNLPNQSEIAGSLVSGTLHFINLSGFIISILLLVTALALQRIFSRGRFVFQLVLLSIVAVATGLGEWVIAARMRGLRAVFRVPIDQIPLDDAGRMAFAALHGYSVIALSVAMIAALMAFIVGSKRAPT
jgi:hypothetical protein